MAHQPVTRHDTAGVRCCACDQPLTAQEARKPRPGAEALCDPCAAYAALGDALLAFRRAAA
jgi:hypothetical protein